MIFKTLCKCGTEMEGVMKKGKLVFECPNCPKMDEITLKPGKKKKKKKWNKKKNNNVKA